MRIQRTLKIPCTADGSRHAHVESIMPVPYVIPDAIRPPTYPVPPKVSNSAYFDGATTPNRRIPTHCYSQKL